MPEPKPKEWTPADPLEDEEDEAETQRVAKATARRKFLETKYEKPAGKDGKEKPKNGIW